MRKRNDSIHFLTKNELKRLLDKAKRQSPRDYCMILLAYRHGLRASEVCNLTVSSVELDAMNIQCRRGKGSISNWQQLEKDEVRAIKTWLRRRGKTDSQYMFTSNRGTPLSRTQFFRAFKSLCKSVNIPEEKGHPHVLKHSLGSHLANAGVPVQVIQQRLGHRNIQNTMVYIQLASGFVDRAVAAALTSGGIL